MIFRLFSEMNRHIEISGCGPQHVVADSESLRRIFVPWVEFLEERIEKMHEQTSTDYTPNAVGETRTDIHKFRGDKQVNQVFAEGTSEPDLEVGALISVI